MNIKRASLNQQFSETYTTQGDLVTIMDHVKPEKGIYDSKIRQPLTITQMH